AIVRCPAIENLRVTVLNESALDTTMIQEMLEKEVTEPIFFELLREANTISHTSLESGFVIAVSALEVGVKYLIKNHLPKAEWLINEIPAPPIEKIVREFYPQLIPGFILEEDKSQLFKSTINMRNQIVHSGKVNNDRKT